MIQLCADHRRLGPHVRGHSLAAYYRGSDATSALGDNTLLTRAAPKPASGNVSFCRWRLANTRPTGSLTSDQPIADGSIVLDN